jgi:hypothetical protein
MHWNVIYRLFINYIIETLILWIVNQLDALNFSKILICLSLSTCFGHYVPIIRRDPIALPQLQYLSFHLAVYLVSTIVLTSVRDVARQHPSQFANSIDFEKL